MKVTLTRADLQEALTALAALTGGRTTKPILGCVKLTADKQGIELCGTDGEAGLRMRRPALAVDQTGEIVVPNERLLGIVRELADVEIRLEATERHCVIRGERSEFKVFVMNPADFPPVPGFEDDPDLVVPGAQLRRMIALTLYAAARETSRYAINGVLWEKQGRKLFFVATDGRRLARAGGSIKTAKAADFQVIVPAKALTTVERVFTGKTDEEWSVGVKVTPNQILLRSGDIVLSSILVEGHFPDYEKVIPKDNDKRAQIGRVELLGAVRQAALLTTDESRAVKLSFEPQQLVLTSQAPEQGEARIVVPMAYDAARIEIGFNPNYLADALRVMPHEEVVIELKEGFRPGILSGEDRAEFQYVVMPVSLTS